MGSVTQTCLFYLVLLCIGLCYGATEAPMQVNNLVDTPGRGKIVGVSFLGTWKECNGPIIITRDDPVYCLARGTYNVSYKEETGVSGYSFTELKCDPALVGAVDLICLPDTSQGDFIPSLCAARVPSQDHIAVFDWHGNMKTTIKPEDYELDFPDFFMMLPEAEFGNGFSVLMRQPDNILLRIFFTETPNGDIEYYTHYPWELDFDVGTSPMTGALWVSRLWQWYSTTTMLVGDSGGWPDRFFYPAAGQFLNIRKIATDGNDNFHVYDAGCSCIKIVSPTRNLLQIGKIVSQFNVSGNISSLTVARSKGLFTNETGAYVYEEKFYVRVESVTPFYCSSVPSGVKIAVSGMDYPARIAIYPDAVKATANVASVVNLPISWDFQIQKPVTAWDDSFYRGFKVVALTYINSTQLIQHGPVNSSVIKPYSGLLSYEIKFSKTSYVYFTVRAADEAKILSTQFEKIELYINVGKGGQDFNLSIDGNTKVIRFLPGDLRNDTWELIQIDLPDIFDSTSSNFIQSISFGININQTKTFNPIYFDLIKLVEWQGLSVPNRKLHIIDQCGIYQDLFVPFEYNPVTLQIESTPTSCNALTTNNDSLTHDGKLRAVVSAFGQEPYRYNWSIFGRQEPDTASTVDGFGYFSSYIQIYDDALNSSFTDLTTSPNYNPRETEVVHSGTYSIMFNASSDGEAIVFKVYPEIEISKFWAIEYWYNGGKIGGQNIKILLISTSIPSATSLSTNIASAEYFAPRVDEWTRAVFNILDLGQISPRKFDTIMIIANAVLDSGTVENSIQTPFYLDDIRILGKNVLTVTDSRGCVVSTPVAKISTPPPMTHSTQVINAKCHGKSDGSILASIQGGTQPYNFSWSSSIIDDSALKNLGEGNYELKVSDFNKCDYSVALEITVLQPPPIGIESTIQNSTCHGKQGSITVSAKGGSGVYTYQWSSKTGLLKSSPAPAPEPVFMDDVSAFFSLEGGETICMGTGTHVGTSYSPSHSGYCSLALFNHSSNATFSGCQTCVSPYASMIFWVLALDSKAVQGLKVSIASSSSKRTKNPIVVTDISLITIGEWSKVVIPMSRFGDDVLAPSKIIFDRPSSASGVVLIDDFVMTPHDSNGAGFAVYSGFESSIDAMADSYYLSVFDVNGCNADYSFELSQPEEMKLDYQSIAPTAEGVVDGKIVIKGVKGGFGPYTYKWIATGLSDSQIDNLQTGSYVIEVTDSGGCSHEFTIYVNTWNGDGVRTIREYNAKLSSGLAALVGFGLLVCLFSAAMLYRYWISFSTLGSFLSSMILVGCVLSFLAALVLLPEPTDALCTSFIWFLGIGFVLVYGCLFIKTWALYKVWVNAVRYQKAHLTPLYIIKCLALAVTVEIIFLAIWTAVDPPKARLMDSINRTAEYQCNTKHITFWIIFLVTKGAWLIFGAVLSVLTRNIAKEYNESSSIAYAIYNNVLLGAIAIPLAILLGEVPGGRLTVEVVIICIAYCFTMVVIFFKIWHSIILPDKIPMNNNEMRKGGRSTASSTGSIKSSSMERSSRDSRASPTLSAMARDDSQSDAAV